MGKSLKNKVLIGLNQTGKFIQKNWKEIGLTGTFLFNIGCSTQNFITEHGYEFDEINQTNNKYKTEKLFLYNEDNYVRKIDKNLYSSLTDSIKKIIIPKEFCLVEDTKKVHDLNNKTSEIKFNKTSIPKQVQIKIEDGTYLPANRIKLLRNNIYTNEGILIPAANARRISDEELLKRNGINPKNLAYSVITTEDDEQFNLLKLNILGEWYFIPYIEDKTIRNELGKKPFCIVPEKGTKVEVCGNERGSIDLVNPAKIYRIEEMNLNDFIIPPIPANQNTTNSIAGTPTL
ncbi:MAG: hypothetical protein KJ566_00980 [Nanoarchaeota archaeon]|nr:hypothetical protein [Nanoarchaeota archaeon]